MFFLFWFLSNEELFVWSLLSVAGLDRVVVESFGEMHRAPGEIAEEMELLRERSALVDLRLGGKVVGLERPSN